MNSKIIKPEKSKFLRYLKAYLPFWQKKKIGFYGYFGHGDLGDDASFYVGRNLLKNDVVPISKRCSAFNPHILKGLIIGGGTILKCQYPFIPRRLLTKDKWNFPVVLFSAGVGCDYNEQFTEESKDKIRKLCHICDYITVRDKISQQFLGDLGFSQVAILPYLELELKDKYRKFDFEKKRFTVGIVLTPHSEFSHQIVEKIVDSFVQFTDYLTDKGNDVIYLPFEKQSSANIRESQIIQEIMKRLNRRDRVRLLGDDVEPQEMLFAIKKYCDIMVCMRLHSAIFATNAGIPFICLSYNLMHKGFIQMMDAADLELSIFHNFSLGSLKDKFEYAQRNYNTIKKRLIEKRDYLRGIIQDEAARIRRIFL